MMTLNELLISIPNNEKILYYDFFVGFCLDSQYCIDKKFLGNEGMQIFYLRDNSGVVRAIIIIDAPTYSMTLTEVLNEIEKNEKGNNNV